MDSNTVTITLSEEQCEAIDCVAEGWNMSRADLVALMVENWRIYVKRIAEENKFSAKVYEEKYDDLFFADFCVLSRSGFVRAADLYNAYAVDNSRRLGKKRFYAEVEKIPGVVREEKGGQIYFYGIRLRDE